MDRWAWVAQYSVAFIVTLLFTMILAGSQLFAATPLGVGLTASHFVEFLGYTTALALLWFGAQRTAETLEEDGGAKTFLKRTLVPLATLVVLGVGYGVPLLLLGPVLSPAALTAYRWLFVFAIIAAAVWVGVSAYTHAVVLMPIVSRVRQRFAPAYPTALVARRCASCGKDLPAGIAVCRACGAPVARAG